jgi:streptogramin lyase
MNAVGTVTTAGVINMISLGDGGDETGIVAASGKVWVTVPNHNALESFTSLAASSRTVYSLLPDAPTGDLAAGPDGNIYIAANTKILELSPGTNTVVQRLTIAPGGFAWGITAGPDGNVWFTEADGNRLGRLTTGGSITEYPLPTANVGPYFITGGPDGNLWFTENLGNRIGRMVPP